MKRWWRLVILALPVLSISLFAGCGDMAERRDVGQEYAVFHEEEFGGVYIDLTIDEFNALGYSYGDSVSIRFSNGYTLEDIPYYNGYYAPNHEALLVAYPGYPHIEAAVSNGDDLWKTAGLVESDTAMISMYEQGKYKDIQVARNIHYEDDRELFDSDAAFANFREVRAGSIAAKRLYRSASPCDNQHNRAPYTEALMEEAGVTFILDLADTDEKIQKYLASDDFNSPYFLSLYEAGQVYPIALSANYESLEYKEHLADGLAQLLKFSGPYLVHCTEGKDRTGFVCMLLEALCGASYEQIRDDYMITYANYYGITRDTDAARYDAIVDNVLNPMLRALSGDENADLSAADISTWAESYLKEGGLGVKEIELLRAKLCV